MGKAKKSETSKNLKVKITDRFRASVNAYKTKAYCHLSDGVKKKYISFDLDTAKRLAKKLPKIIDLMTEEQEKEALTSSSDLSSDSE